MQFGTVEQALADIKAGKLIIVGVDEDRENEGDLICAAEVVTREMIIFMFRKAGGRFCIALVYGDVGPDFSVLVRMHSKCLTGDVFHSLRCDCGWQLETAMKMIAKEGKGVIVYLDQEGRGIGLLNKLKAYELQDQGVDTVEANERLGFAPDLRNYGIGAQILLDLGLRTIRPITNNPRKLVGLEGYGLTIDERVPIISIAHDENSSYLEAKRAKLGHLFAS